MLNQKCWKLVVMGFVAMFAIGTSLMAGNNSNYIWIEGEKPVKQNFKFKVDTPYSGNGPVFSKKNVASGGEFITYTFPKKLKKTSYKNAKKQTPKTLEKMPKGGYSLQYEFNVDKDDSYDAWFNIGYEIDRSPMKWRIDNGEWQKVSPKQVGASLIFKNWHAPAFSWVKSTNVKLSSGKHSLEFLWNEVGMKGTTQIGIDAIAFVKGYWQPDGVLKPDEKYNEQIDKDGSKQVFTIAKDTSLKDGEVQTIDLKGIWELARYDDPNLDIDTYKPITKLPTSQEYALEWRGIYVPLEIGVKKINGATKKPKQYRAELRGVDRILYRTKINVPADMKKSSFRLYLPHINWIVSIFVNGKLCDARMTEMVPWEADITKAIEYGKENVITIAIKTFYPYASEPAVISANHKDTRYMHYHRHNTSYKRQKITPYSGWGFPSCDVVGLKYTPELRIGGEVYPTDVHIQTSVQDMDIDSTITLKNPTNKIKNIVIRSEAVNDKTGKVEKTLPEKTVSIPANGEAIVHTEDIWMSPKLWWPTEGPKDKPDCYLMRTTLLENGKPINISEDLFGFQEITYNGRQLILNNVPQHFWNYYNIKGALWSENVAENYYKYNIRGIRLNGFTGIGGKAKPMDSLKWLARNGIPTRQCLNGEGMMFGNAMDKAFYWENTARHIKQALPYLRNLPNIMNYSIANELFLINGRAVTTTYEIAERRGAATANLVKKLDPQRRAFFDGGGDLGGLLEMNCQHYTLPKGKRFPWRCYDHIKRAEPVRPRRKHNWTYHNYKSREDMFLWNGNVPWILGEVGFYAGKREKSVFVGGPDTYDSAMIADDAWGKYVRICAEGLRWQENTELCLWAGCTSEITGAYKAWKYKAAFLRERDCVHFPNSLLKRTVRVFNDTRLPAGLFLTIQVVFDDKVTDEWTKQITVAPGRWMQDIIEVNLPSAEKRKEGILRILLTEGKKEGTPVYQEDRDLILQPIPKAVDVGNASNLSVWDPQGKVSAWLDRQGQYYTKIIDLNAVDTSKKVLIVGTYALPATTDKIRASYVAKINDLANKGVRIIILEQDYPLQGDELPFKGINVASPKGSFQLYQEFAGAVDANGAIAFPVVPAHPIFRDIDQKDFYTWADHATNWEDRRDLVFINSYQNPKVGTLLVQGMGALKVTSMLNLDIGKGSILLSQLLIGDKIDIEPTAGKLLMNMIKWAVTAGAKVIRPTFLVASDEYKTFFDKTGVTHTQIDTIEKGLATQGSIIIAEGTKANIASLANNKEKIVEHCTNGGWIMVSGLTPDALSDFNKLTGLQQQIRPFRVEKVLLKNKRNELLFGLTSAGLEQYQNKVLASYAGKWFRSGTVFSNVLSYQNIMPFANITTVKQQLSSNNLVYDDFWMYSGYMRIPGIEDFKGCEDYDEELKYDFNQPQTIKSFEFVLNPSYHYIKELGIIFDGNEAKMQTITLDAKKRPQIINLEKEIKASSVTFKILSVHSGKKFYCGLDNIRMNQPLSKEMQAKVIPLSDPAGLIKYPIGEGGIVLNQLDYKRDDRKQIDDGTVKNIKRVKTPDDNLNKKVNLTANLLSNMGAEVK